MNETKTKNSTSNKYLLLHITTEKNAINIKKERKMHSSIHNVENHSIQWLGDGVYFWDGNDSKAKKHGKNMVKKRYPKEKLVGLSGVLDIDASRHIDLEDKNWNLSFVNFSKKTEYLIGDSLCDLLDSIKDVDVVDSSTLYKIGILMGKTVNLYIKMLKDKKNKVIDAFSCYFYHGKGGLVYFSRKDINIKQFCIKNDKLISDNIDKMDIDYNI